MRMRVNSSATLHAEDYSHKKKMMAYLPQEQITTSAEVPESSKASDLTICQHDNDNDGMPSAMDVSDDTPDQLQSIAAIHDGGNVEPTGLNIAFMDIDQNKATVKNAIGAIQSNQMREFVKLER